MGWVFVKLKVVLIYIAGKYCDALLSLSPPPSPQILAGHNWKSFDCQYWGWTSKAFVIVLHWLACVGAKPCFNLDMSIFRQRWYCINAAEEHDTFSSLLTPLHHATFPFFCILMSQNSCVYFLPIPMSVSLLFSRPYILSLTPTTSSPDIANASAYMCSPKSHLIALHADFLGFLPLETTKCGVSTLVFFPFHNYLFADDQLSSLVKIFFPEFQIHMLNRLLGITNKTANSTCSYVYLSSTAHVSTLSFILIPINDPVILFVI